MFKKIASLTLAAMLVGSAAVAVGAAENEDAVAAADDSAVAAADDSAVAANDDSSATGASTRIYFDASTSGWNNYKTITFFLLNHDTGEQIITWGSKKGNMKQDASNKNLWYFDLEGNYALNSGVRYGCNFTADWNAQTCDLIISQDNYGDTAHNTGEMVENNVDSNKKSYVVKWKSGKNGNPICVTSIGNIIGDTYWSGDTAESVFTKFLASTGKDGLENAIKYNGKTVQQTVDDTAKALGLNFEQTKKCVADAKAQNADAKKVSEWDESKSSLNTGGSSDGQSTTAASGSDNSSGSNSGSSNSGSSTGSSSSSGSSGSSSSSGSSGTTTSSVTSGEGTTIYFIIGGVMMAALGVFFLARKKKED